MNSAASNYETWPTKKLIARIYQLEAAVQSLEESTAIDKASRVAAAFGLTKMQARIVVALARGKVIENRSIYEAVYYDCIGGPPVSRVVASQIHRIRRKLFAFGITIETFSGIGFQMHGWEAVRDVIESEQGPPALSVVDVEPGSVQRKCQLVLDEIRRRKDVRGVSQFSTAQMKAATKVGGGLVDIIQGFERRGLLMIIDRPTRKSPKRHWRLSLKDDANE